MKNKEYALGIWTPWAKVYCYDCCGYHSSMKRSEEEFNSRKGMYPLKEENEVTFCDDCGKEIQLYDEVALEHNLVKNLKEKGIDANMYQSGGMCSACWIDLKDGGYILAKGSINEGFYKGYFCERYSDEGDYEGEEYTFFCETEKEMINYIDSLEEVCRIK